MTALALAACTTADDLKARVEEYNHPGFLGRIIDRPPPAVAVTSGEPTGALLAGPGLAELPDTSVDRVVAAGLKDWLTFAERKDLALASERAAIGATGVAVEWRSHDGARSPTANGSAVAVDDVYRSLRGQVCRDVRQNITKLDDSHEATVMLCRTEIAAGVAMWAVAAAD